MKENKYALKILSEDDHTAVYGGYGVGFGSGQTGIYRP